MTSRRVHAVVTGVVQGVGFRLQAADVARSLGLTGYIRNRDDGSVETEAQGEPEAVDRYLRWLETGPAAARVSGVVTEPLPPTESGGSESGGFHIRR